MDTPHGPEQTLADKLNRLFATCPRADGREYSNQQVASAVQDSGVVRTISPSYIWQLRTGAKDNPTYRHLRGLAEFFGVPVSYFFDDEVSDRVDARLAEIRAERRRVSELVSDDQARVMALRAGELSPEGRRQVMDLLDVVYRLERSERGTQEPGG
ncbi:helix-turn-helix transcriptional regulator [Haloechinothrix sp. YIM 98757]|uniref:Helix-turn-helix transcriptional regulator n=1 Tax=Haloechinothrix aidingensis TaxID=2752311 RepID=A0A838ADH6_9PSEU|nr:helix-turn-helix domain-containing protein [Haloechinothrix aidingensis]MBA0127263.1 helix-turn-helix transcriptional regulator [Haloechinothrix aidingensis]